MFENKLWAELPSMRVTYRIEVQSSAAQFEATETRSRLELGEVLHQLIPALQRLSEGMPGHHALSLWLCPLVQEADDTNGAKRLVSRLSWGPKGKLRQTGEKLQLHDADAFVEQLKGFEAGYPVLEAFPPKKKAKDDEDSEDDEDEDEEEEDDDEEGESDKDKTNMKTQGPEAKDGEEAPAPKDKEFWPPKKDKNRKKRGPIPGLSPEEDGVAKVGQRISMPTTY